MTSATSYFHHLATCLSNMQKECSSKDVIRESILDLHLVLNGHLYKYTAETWFYDR